MGLSSPEVIVISLRESLITSVEVLLCRERAARGGGEKRGAKRREDMTSSYITSSTCKCSCSHSTLTPLSLHSHSTPCPGLDYFQMKQQSAMTAPSI